MLALLGYDLYGGINSLNPNPITPKKVNYIKLRNAVFDYLYGTTDTNITMNSKIEWNFPTFMFAQFMNNLAAGNLGEQLSNIIAIQIDRLDETNGKWVMVYYKELDNPTIDDFNFIFKDFTCKYGDSYSYKTTPILRSGASSSSLITTAVNIKFRDVFLCDNTASYRLLANVQYGNWTQQQKIGVFEPIGRRYPVTVSNAETNYQSGTVQSKVIGNYLDIGEFDKQDITKQKDDMLKFLCNKQPKILKDANGNMWLIAISGAPSINYDNNYNAGIMDVQFNFVEVGDAEDEKDLTSCGIVPLHVD